MTGLEKMKSQILEEAHTCAEKILEDTSLPVLCREEKLF